MVIRLADPKRLEANLAESRGFQAQFPRPTPTTLVSFGQGRFSKPLRVVKLTQLSNFTTVRSERLMETEKVLCYSAMGVAGLVCLIFLLDAALGILGRANIVMDIMFILGGAFVLWQGVETARELN